MPGTSDDLIAVLEARIADLERRLALAEEELTARKRHASNNSMSKTQVSQAARLKMARGQSKNSLVEYASDAGLTLRDLASRVGCSGPLLTQARKGDRTISMELAQRVRAATRSAKHPEGFGANKENWPGLRVE